MRTSAASSSFDLDPDALQAAEFMQVGMFLDALVGETIAVATTAPDRTTISTTSGLSMVFCGFAGVTRAD